MANNIRRHYVMEPQTKTYVVGIRREDKSVWQRRAVLSPKDVKELSSQHPEIRFVFQPSPLRIFSDQEYIEAGAQSAEDLSGCHLIVGVKEVPGEKLLANRTYMFFSHVIKAQPHNMPMLDQLLEKKIRLIDYEKIVDEKGNRLIAFGVFAGLAGAIDYLAGFGHYLLLAGYSTPLLNINYSYKYFNLDDAYSNLAKVSERLHLKQIDIGLRPLIFAVTGRGRTANGVLKVLSYFKQVKTIHPDEMEKLVANPNNPEHATTIYLANINTEDVTVPRDITEKFDKETYYKNPDKFKNKFSKKYLPYISCLFHCIFWDSKFPRYIKNKHLKKLADAGKLRLFGICDVTCDADGSIECLKKFTSPDRPFFFYDPQTEEESYYFEYKKNRIMYLALDYLPSELSYDATMYFSNILKQWIANVCHSDRDKPLAEQGLLPELQRATITLNGQLTPNFQYIQELRLKRQESSRTTQSMIKQKELVRNKKQEKDEDDLKPSTIQNKQLDKNVAKVQPTAIDFSGDAN